MRQTGWRGFCALVFSLVAWSGCAKKIVEEDVGGSPSSPLAAAKLSAAGYSPNNTLIGIASGKGTVQTSSRTLYYTNVGMVRFNDPWGNKQITVDLGNYNQATDFGSNGSISLVAEVKNYPIAGGAYAVLTEFSVESGGVTTSFVNLTSSCSTGGMWQCSGSSCSANPSCTVQATSSFANRTDWDQHQVPPFGYVTSNSFPRCDGSVGSWNCPVGGLPSGHYRAKYLLLSNSGNPVDSRLADLSVQVVVRKDTGTGAETTKGGLKVNLILVGDQNINDSRTTKGARNLNLLFAELNRIFKTVSGASMTLSQLKVYEWRDADGGSQYSAPDLEALGNLFESGSKGLDASDSGQFVNVFLVSDIIYGGAYTILGLSGGILGPPVNGTQTSGLAFSSFDQLGTFNPKCLSDSCGRHQQEADFLEMAATIAHEIGHYLGLNHPSEQPVNYTQENDPLNDTPTCAYRLVSGSTAVLDQRACYREDATVHPAPLGSKSCQTACNAVTGATSYMNLAKSSAAIDSYNYSGSVGSNGDMPLAFCPAVPECQFNHVMWYTTKNRKMTSSGGVGLWAEDGNLFSLQSRTVMQWSPLVR